MLTATIIVVAILTALIFTLTIVAFSSMLKSEKREIELGSRDEEIKRDIEKEKKKSSKAFNIVSSIVGGLIALSLLAASVTAVVYKAQGEQFAINNQVSLVIVSDSMNGFYNDKYEIELLEYKDDAGNDQFKIGDIVTFEKITEEEELIPFDVYGYKNSKGQTITHRYISENPKNPEQLIFRGDNTGGRDSYVDRSQVVLHYTNFKIQGAGMFVLFSQSGFGLYSFISVITVYTLAEMYAYRYEKLVNHRIKVLDEQKNVELDDLKDEQAAKPAKESLKDKKKDDRKLVSFTTKSGQKVSFYIKSKEKKADEKQDS